MAHKDYYLILGVPRTEDLRGIQEAFRELAKKYHPDLAGPEATAKFQDIQEAYEILSDPEKRELYNHQLDVRGIRVHSRPEPIYSRPQSRPEPLIPEPVSFLYEFQTVGWSRQPALDRFMRDFPGEKIFERERTEELRIEIVLSPDEAATGISVRLDVPVTRTCPYCGGLGHSWLFVCDVCDGAGRIESEEAVTIRVPPGISDGAVFEVPIRGPGIRNRYAGLHIRIER